VSLTPDDVLHVARLAALDLPESEIPKLTAELDAIVSYVGQLIELGDRPGEPFVAGPLLAPLRPDQVRATPLYRPPAEFAPEFREGFFLVPRLTALDES